VQACEAVLVSQIHNYKCYRGEAACVYASDEPTDLVNVVGSLYAPFCVTNELHSYYRKHESNRSLFKSSTLGQLNIAELLAEAEQSAFGKGTETLIDTSVRNSFEIPAEKLNQDTLNFLKSHFDLKGLAPRMEVEVRPYKLVIYQEGGFFREHRDSVRGESHIGTLVYILSSKFTGGELVVRQNDKERSIHKPYQWMAMYGDCAHRIEPVTSGTRVSLIFDLYQVRCISDADYFQQHEEGGGMMTFAEDGHQHAPDAATTESILTALDDELAAAGTVVICLTHLYPLCQADPTCLKGGDSSLYTLLHGADKYDLTVVPIAVSYEKDSEYPKHSSITANLIDLQFDLPSSSKNQTNNENVVLIIPSCCDSGHVLFEQEHIEHVGNNAQNEETQYLTTGLRVVKKE